MIAEKPEEGGIVLRLDSKESSLLTAILRSYLDWTDNEGGGLDDEFILADDIMVELRG